MKKIYFLLLSTISLLLVNDVKAQLKLGDQPTSVQKSVILDLQGSNGRQGVWLPRISDTTDATGIDALNPPDGVMIYHSPSSHVMIRRNGFWSSLQTNQTYTTGTSGTDFTINSSGTTHTFNIPTASALNRGLLSSADWTTFNNKGTVSSVGAGYGMNGGTITTTGTLAVDTLLISTKAWRQKGIDSVTSLLNAYIPATRTLNGLALSSNQTFAFGFSGNDLSINSSGTTHTFNVPNASATARGVVTTGAQTFAGLKTFSNGLTSSTTTTVSGSASNASNLYLGINSGTAPGSSTDRYLSVDATGRVILSSIGVINSLAAIGSSPNANGATLSAGTFTLQPASASFGGVVTTGTQTFSGTKTFQDPMSAKVNLQGGTAAAGTAPLKFTSGTNLATPENGAVEYDGTNYYATSGGTRYTLAKTLTATATLDFPNTGGFGTSSVLTITVNGAADGDAVVLGIPSAAMAIDGVYTAYVSSANTISIVFTNNTWGSMNPGSGTFRVSVLKY